MNHSERAEAGRALRENVDMETFLSENGVPAEDIPELVYLWRHDLLEYAKRIKKYDCIQKLNVL